MQNKNNEDEIVSWAEFQSERCKKLFGTDDLENDDVLNYFIMALQKSKKPVRIVQDNEIYNSNEYIVAYFDDEEGCYFALFLSKIKEECEEFVKINNLFLSNRKDIRHN